MQIYLFILALQIKSKITENLMHRYLPLWNYACEYFDTLYCTNRKSYKTVRGKGCPKQSQRNRTWWEDSYS